jgi:hypothetical protein
MRKVPFPVEDRQRRRLGEVCHGESDTWTAEDGDTLIQNEL